MDAVIGLWAMLLATLVCVVLLRLVVYLGVRNNFIEVEFTGWPPSIRFITRRD